jgi:NAD(P)H-hydrate repair Nnr-like enzyme with NAD(P)H-hydrate dehydratase domain
LEGSNWDEAACERAFELMEVNSRSALVRRGGGNIYADKLRDGSRPSSMLDAMRLNQMASQKEMLSLLHPNVRSDAHPAEMARLQRRTAEAILNTPSRPRARLPTLEMLVLLKGADDCVSDGNRCA